MLLRNGYQWRIQDLPWGAPPPRGSYISKILYVETKESGPLGGGRAPPMDIIVVCQDLICQETSMRII